MSNACGAESSLYIHPLEQLSEFCMSVKLYMDCAEPWQKGLYEDCVSFGVSQKKGDT